MIVLPVQNGYARIRPESVAAIEPAWDSEKDIIRGSLVHLSGGSIIHSSYDVDQVYREITNADSNA
jgi:hypothetical protein